MSFKNRKCTNNKCAKFNEIFKTSAVNCRSCKKALETIEEQQKWYLEYNSEKKSAPPKYRVVELELRGRDVIFHNDTPYNCAATSYVAINAIGFRGTRVKYDDILQSGFPLQPENRFPQPIIIRDSCRPLVTTHMQTKTTISWTKSFGKGLEYASGSGYLYFAFINRGIDVNIAVQDWERALGLGELPDYGTEYEIISPIVPKTKIFACWTIKLHSPNIVQVTNMEEYGWCENSEDVGTLKKYRSIKEIVSGLNKDTGFNIWEAARAIFNKHRSIPIGQREDK